MEEHHTNKKKLVKGVKYLAGSLPLAFIGPSVIYNAVGKNQDKFLYYPILILAVLVTFTAAFLMFKGIQIIMKGLFDD